MRQIIGGTLGRETQASGMAQKELEADAFAIYASGCSRVKPHKVLIATEDCPGVSTEN